MSVLPPQNLVDLVGDERASLPQAFLARVSRSADADFVIWEGRHWSYAQALEEVCLVRGFLDAAAAGAPDQGAGATGAIVPDGADRGAGRGAWTPGPAWAALSRGETPRSGNEINKTNKIHFFTAMPFFLHPVHPAHPANWRTGAGIAGKYDQFTPFAGESAAHRKPYTGSLRPGKSPVRPNTDNAHRPLTQEPPRSVR